MSGVQRLQHHRITFDVVTRASEPLVIDDYTREQMRLAVERAARESIDLRYYPESRYGEERHEWIGVDLPEDQP